MGEKHMANLVHYTLYVEPGMLSKLGKLAKKEQRSIAQVVRMLLADALSRVK
jgi:hypothetical protein